MLSLDGLPPPVREQTRRNAVFYAPRITDLVPSAAIAPIVFPVPDGWSRFNPSVAAAEDGYRVLVRSSNYTMAGNAYTIHDDGGAIRTHNYLLSLGANLAVQSVEAIDDDPAKGITYPFPVVGFEDCRLFSHEGGWHVSATTREHNPAGVCQIALLRLADGAFRDPRLLSGVERHEKNWAPLSLGGGLSFIYSFRPTVVLRYNEQEGRVDEAVRHPGPAIAEHFRGGSQAIALERGFLCLVHEAVVFEDGGRAYSHRFVLLDKAFTITHLSPQFFFLEPGVEFCAGLALRGEVLTASFGSQDSAAYLASMNLQEALATLRPIEFDERKPPSGGAVAARATPAKRSLPRFDRLSRALTLLPGRAPLLTRSAARAGDSRSPSQAPLPQSALSSSDTAPGYTLVSCLFDLRRREGVGRRPIEFYLQHAQLVLGLPVPMVLYIDPELAGWAAAFRRERNLHSMTQIVPRRLEELSLYRLNPLLPSIPSFRNRDFTKDTHLHQIVEWSKLDLVAEAAEANHFGTDRYAWIDLGIGYVARPPETSLLPSERVSILQMRAVAPSEVQSRQEFYSDERGRLAAGFFAGHQDALAELRRAFRAELDEALALPIRPNDQMILSYLSVGHGDLFDFYYGDYSSILTNWDGIRHDLPTVLRNVAHCRTQALWEAGSRICQTALDSLRRGILTVSRDEHAQLLDESFLAAWYGGRPDLLAGLRDEFLTCCADSQYFAHHRERILGNFGMSPTPSNSSSVAVM